MADVLTFAGQTLTDLGVYVRDLSGLRRLPPLEANETALRFRDNVSPVWIGRRGGSVDLAGVIQGRSRALFEANVSAFKQLIAPTEDQNTQPTYVALTWDQYNGKRLMIYTTDFDPQEKGPRFGEFTWTIVRKPFWEDEDAVTETGLVSASIVAYSGDVKVFPVWTVAFDGASTGFDFTCVGRVDLDTTEFVNTDTLVIDSAVRTIKKNGVSVMANLNIANTTQDWPYLAPGNNTVTVTTGTNYSISVTYRALYE
jgi:hypothetical protein